MKPTPRDNGIEAARWRMVHNDTCAELMDTGQWPDCCVHQIVTSIPFGTQYEYCASLNDMGHNPHNGAFWEQMDFLIPNLLRVTKPGRVACIHVKDRIRFGNMTGAGFPTVEPFSDECVAAFRKHGWYFMGRITIDTDVVRENAQTYRLTWGEMVKDGTKMGAGMPEYVLLFRKAQSDQSRGYADDPVTRPDERVNGTYSMAQWQLDASGLWRSSGDRLPPPEVLAAMDLGVLRRLWRAYSADGVYDLAQHEQMCQTLMNAGRLPGGWMLFPAVPRHPDIWGDVERIRTLNSEQARRNQEQHVCPLQLDVIERCIRRYSMEGEVIFDPFAGIGSVPYQALKMRRRGWGCELNGDYWDTAVRYCEQAAADDSTQTLFDLERLASKEVAA